MSKSSILLACAGLALVGLCGCQSGGGMSGGMSGSGPAAKVNPAPLQAQARQAPPATATQSNIVGSGPLLVNTANFAGDNDCTWYAQFDIDGDGDFETTQMLWDDEDKMLYAYAETDVACSMGGTATVAILAGVNGAGNPRGRPAGSGFFALYFDGTECGALTAGVYGCHFDSSGNVSRWGMVVVDSFGDEIDAVGN